MSAVYRWTQGSLYHMDSYNLHIIRLCGAGGADNDMLDNRFAGPLGSPAQTVTRVQQRQGWFISWPVKRPAIFARGGPSDTSPKITSCYR